MSNSPKRKIISCQNCFWTWNNQSDKNEIRCPKCSKKIDARNRSSYWQKRILKDPQLLSNAKTTFFNKRSRDTRRSTNTKKRIKALLLVGKGVIACNDCGCDDVRLMEINHINGQGNIEFKKIGGTSGLVQQIVTLKRNTDDLNLLCRVCNARHYLEQKFGKLAFEIIWKKSNSMI